MLGNGHFRKTDVAAVQHLSRAFGRQPHLKGRASAQPCGADDAQHGLLGEFRADNLHGAARRSGVFRAHAEAHALSAHKHGRSASERKAGQLRAAAAAFQFVKIVRAGDRILRAGGKRFHSRLTCSCSSSISRWLTVQANPFARRRTPSSSAIATERCIPPVQPTPITSLRLPSCS